MFMQIFGLTQDQAKEHTRLKKLGRIFITENSRSGCNYQVIIRQAELVPQQFELGEEIVQIMVRRIDGKEEPIPWRDLQDIKDVVIGHEREALELYPAHKRRMHDMRFRVLWGVLSNEEIKIGWPKEKDAEGNEPNSEPVEYF